MPATTTTSSADDSHDEIEKALAAINSIHDGTKLKYQKFLTDLFQIAKDTSIPFFSASSTAQTFARQGLPADEVLKRTHDALKLAWVAGVSVGKAAQSITVAINLFAKDPLNSAEIVNRIAAADAALSVSAKDLAKAVSYVGESATIANVSFEQLIALVTKAQEATSRGGEVIGSALKTIFTRVQRSDVIALLKFHGIESDSAMHILEQIAARHVTMDRESVDVICEAIGGVRHTAILKALLLKISSLPKDSKTATNTINEATQRNETLNKSFDTTDFADKLSREIKEIVLKTLAEQTRKGGFFHRQ